MPGNRPLQRIRQMRPSQDGRRTDARGRKPARDETPEANAASGNTAEAHTGHEPVSEEALFTQAMRDVQRHQPRRAPPAPPDLDPTPHHSRADEEAALRQSREEVPEDIDIAAGDILDFRAPGLPEAVYRRLCRGQFHIRDELDLHGMTRREAQAAVRDFLAACRARDRRCVRIVHGKGLRSGESGPVLKRHLDGWLRRRREVLGFHSARREHGGAGAVYVLLRRDAA